MFSCDGSVRVGPANGSILGWLVRDRGHDLRLCVVILVEPVGAGPISVFQVSSLNGNFPENNQ